VDASAKGKRYPPFEYEVGKEKIREFAQAVGEDNAVYFDRAAAREAGSRDIPAPPMFAVVYSAGAMGPAILDPEVGIKGFYVFESVSTNQAGAEVVRATWTNIVRGV